MSQPAVSQGNRSSIPADSVARRDSIPVLLRFLRAAWLPLVIGFIGLLPFYGKDSYFGELCDSRLNMFFMEHGYQSMLHGFQGFWDAPFFYPHKNVFAYSDHMLGHLPFYAALRAIGFSREQAFGWWEIGMVGLSYFSAYLALRKVGAQRLSGCLAAYVFAYGLPVHGQVFHIQLLPRFLVPWTFVCATRLSEEGRTRHWAWLAFLIAAEMYLGIYLALLTAICVGAYFLAWAALGNWREVFSRWVGPTKKDWAIRIAIAGLALVAVLPTVIPYLKASRELGGRNWGEVTLMLPRIGSWFFPAESSLLWGWIGHVNCFCLYSLPYNAGHRNFVGLAMGLAFALWPLMKNPDQRATKLCNRAWWSAVICFVLTLYLYRFSLWRFIYWMPGIGAIRGVSRIGIFMLFPMAMVLAAALNRLSDWARARFSGDYEGKAKVAALGGLLTLLVLLDSSVSGVEQTSYQEARARVEPLKAALAKLNPKPGTPFWYCSGNLQEHHSLPQVDAMIVSQDLGIPTLNGYSGWEPPGYQLSPQGETADGQLEAVRSWLKIHPANALDSIVVVDSQGARYWTPGDNSKKHP